MLEDYLNNQGASSTNDDATPTQTPIYPDVEYDSPTATNGAFLPESTFGGESLDITRE